MEQSALTGSATATQEVAQAVEETAQETKDFFSDLAQWFQDSLPVFIKVALVAVIGFLLAKLILKLCKRWLGHSKLDKSAHHFFYSVIRGIIYVILILVILQTIGVEISSVVALFSVCGVALSLAVQDSLSNVCGGVLLLVSKPLELGDYVLVDGVEGEVVKISLLNIKLHTIDNKAIYIPNSVVSQNQIINFSKEPNRQLEIDFPIGYDDDFHRAEDVIRRVVLANDKAIPQPTPMVRMNEYADSAVMIRLRVWVKKEDYWELRYDVLEQVKEAFDKEGISIPFQQMDVHVVSPEGGGVPLSAESKK